MEPDFIITIVRIKEQLGIDLYLAEDVFDCSEVQISGWGKMMMSGFPALQPADECTIYISTSDVSKGRIINTSDLKVNQRASIAYRDIRKRYESEFGPYTDDYMLIKRAT